MLGDLRDWVWQLEDDAAAICKDGDATVGALCVEVQKRNEQTGVRKGLLLLFGIMIFVSGLVVGMILS